MKTEEIIAVITENVNEDRKNDLLLQIKNDPQLYKEYNSLKNAWALSSFQSGMPESKIRKAYLIQKEKIRKQKTVLLMHHFYSFMKYAAILLIVFWAGMFFNKYLTDGSVSTVGLAEVVVPLGQMAEVNLPDGSHVWINSDTRLSFTKTFNGKEREVKLNGEAYFKVRKDKKPFVVTTGFGQITVLGTSFNVQAYEDSKFQATLVNGSIRYTNKMKKSVVLTPGQQLYFSQDDSILVREVKTDLYTSWKDGVIIFKKEPLKEVVRKLERHFDVKIVLEDSSLEDICFTGNIKNESLPDVLELINKTKPIQYTYDKKLKKINIRTKGPF